MRDDTFRESRNMTVSKKLKDGRVLIPQDILTSTRKGPSAAGPAAHRRDRGGRRRGLQAAPQALHVVHQGDARTGQELPVRQPESSRGPEVPVQQDQARRVGDRRAPHARSDLPAATSTRAVAGSPTATSSSSSPRTTARPSRPRCSAPSPRCAGTTCRAGRTTST